MNELQHLYEKINPKDDPKMMAERIIARSKAEQASVKTRRRLKWVPVAVSLALVLAAAVPVTASAMAGSNIFEVFKSYFNTQELNSVGMVEYDKTIELDDYKLTINGFAADKHCVCVSYDIEYKDEWYFENGELKQEVLELSPVSFMAEPQICFKAGGCSWGGGKVISVDGATVSYASFADSSNSFLTTPFTDKYLVKISYTCEGANSDGSFRTEEMEEHDRVIYVGIPAAKDIILNVNREVTYPDGRDGVLEQIELNSLSVYYNTAPKEERIDMDSLAPQEERIDMNLFAPKLVFKDGTELDLAGHWRSCGSGYTTEDGRVGERHFNYAYGTPIDPETIEAVEILGKTYTVE